MIRYITFFIVLLAILYACSSDSGSNPVAPNFSSVYTEILEVRCAKSGCHDGNHPRLNMNSKLTAYTELLNKTSSIGLKYIQPGSADSSFLYLKIIPDDSGRPGSARMPRDGETNGYLSSSQIETIRDWILDGAKNN